MLSASQGGELGSVVWDKPICSTWAAFEKVVWSLVRCLCCFWS